jgi:hypothetical protein
MAYGVSAESAPLVSETVRTVPLLLAMLVAATPATAAPLGQLRISTDGVGEPEAVKRATLVVNVIEFPDERPALRHRKTMKSSWGVAPAVYELPPSVLCAYAACT